MQEASLPRCPCHSVIPRTHLGTILQQHLGTGHVPTQAGLVQSRHAVCGQQVHVETLQEEQGVRGQPCPAQLLQGCWGAHGREGHGRAVSRQRAQVTLVLCRDFLSPQTTAGDGLVREQSQAVPSLSNSLYALSIAGNASHFFNL